MLAGVIAARGQDAGAGVGDVGQDGRFFGDVALHGGYEVRDEIETALLHDIDLREGLIDGLILLHQSVFRADVAAANKEQHDNEKTDNTKHNP